MESISMEQLLKEHRALEIIKEKGLCWLAFMKTEDYREYNATIQLRYMNKYYHYTDLTKEEYDLLKEVFL